MDALEKTSEWTEGGPEAVEAQEARVAAENARAVAQLNSMMRGLK